MNSSLWVFTQSNPNYLPFFPVYFIQAHTFSFLFFPTSLSCISVFSILSISYWLFLPSQLDFKMNILWSWGHTCSSMNLLPRWAEKMRPRPEYKERSRCESWDASSKAPVLYITSTCRGSSVVVQRLSDLEGDKLLFSCSVWFSLLLLLPSYTPSEIPKLQLFKSCVDSSKMWSPIPILACLLWAPFKLFCLVSSEATSETLCFFWCFPLIWTFLFHNQTIKLYHLYLV